MFLAFEGHERTLIQGVFLFAEWSEEKICKGFMSGLHISSLQVRKSFQPRHLPS